MSVILTLPYPVSANRYWKHAARGGRAVTYVSKEAKEYREAVGTEFLRKYGARMPLDGPIIITLFLTGPLPKDAARRERKEGPLWWLKARCIDLGNAEKVLADALQGIAYHDDKQIVEQRKFRQPPDEKGARVSVIISTWNPA